MSPPRDSRYRGDSELTRINKVAAAGGSIDIDPETAGLIACAKACFVNSDGSFDITSGLLRKVWDFSAAQLPDQGPIDAVLPLIGLDKVTLSSGRLHFWQFAWRRRADKNDNLLRADLGYWVCMFIAGDVVWFALNEDRPLVAFPKSKPVPGPHLVYGFLTTSPNAVVEPIHPKATLPRHQQRPGLD